MWYDACCCCHLQVHLLVKLADVVECFQGLQHNSLTHYSLRLAGQEWNLTQQHNQEKHTTTRVQQKQSDCRADANYECAGCAVKYSMICCHTSSKQQTHSCYVQGIQNSFLQGGCALIRCTTRTVRHAEPAATLTSWLIAPDSLTAASTLGSRVRCVNVFMTCMFTERSDYRKFGLHPGMLSCTVKNGPGPACVHDVDNFVPTRPTSGGYTAPQLLHAAKDKYPDVRLCQQK